MAQNKSNFKTNNTYRVSVVMLVYWLLINVVLFSLINVISNQWMIINGFNLGFVGSFIGFLILASTSKWFFSKTTFKQVLAYFTFLIRIAFYGAIVTLAIVFNSFNWFSILGGFSLLVLATITSEFLFFRQGKKEKTKC
ncbi:ATP synthase subunit I [Spiroplasma platyhelix]|uniref:Uncharacterized protein n=1 Tax=Spiroplasma platyhelix PALS-1 TaxID=1276218 RepID=A0A846UDM0_9MOLU|nr:ATP synthase subunit I [Spiroplasma platyhelix]NKE38598.1 hypothetical protein [Spiroplasma platyhelix PALS-1]